MKRKAPKNKPGPGSELGPQTLANLPELQPDYCPSCHERRPMDEWIGVDFDFDPTKMLVCASCRSSGSPPRDPLPQLSLKERRVIRDMLITGSPSEVAKKHGLKPATVSSWFSGKSKPHIRRALQITLEREGLDMFSMVRMAKQLLGSTKAQWNRDTQAWDHFPDNMARLNAWRHLTKLHEVEPMNERESAAPPITVAVQTNLGSTEKATPVGTYTIEVEKADG